MTEDARARRRQAHARLGAHLAGLDEEELRALLATGPGTRRVVEVGGDRVFVKRVLVADSDLEGGGSTRNLHGLPARYSYGIGSIGFGPFRELATHLKTTGWVLRGEAGAFPLLHHHRIVPRLGEPAAADMDRHARYVARWGGDRAIGRYVLERAGARHELVLFLEHLPHVLERWLLEHPDQVPRLLDDLRATLDLLHENGMVHFDSHFANVLTDGGRAYLSDFGLLLDPDFDLGADERAFLDAHRLYDYGRVLWSLGLLLHDTYLELPDEARRRVAGRCGMGEGGDPFAVPRILVGHLERIRDEGLMPLHDAFAASVLRYRPVTLLVHDFHAALRASPRKDTPFPGAELRRLLEETGFAPRAAAAAPPLPPRPEGR
ncbi:MAG TPA: hypothetical protein VF615_09065 [Longimicrobiaceae bacterium]|jgi:hypothetical protein